MDGQPRVSLILPAFNEAAGIRQAVAEADEALANLAADYEILIVDDGSRDGTAALVKEMTATRPHVRLVRHTTNRGYGAALRTGFTAARFERVAFTDADCQFHLADLSRLLPLAETHAVVAGYREERQDSWRRCLLSRGYNLLVRTLLGTRVRDCDCALKVFRREELCKLLPEATGFFVNTEMLTRARQLDYDVAEVGVRHRPRLRGRSTVSLREVPRVLRELLPFWWGRVLFPGSPLPCTQGRGVGGEGWDASTPHPQPLSPEYRGEGSRMAALPALLLCLIAALLFFGQLRAPLLEPQEPRYAEIPRQMLDEGRWITPVLHGQPYLDKPPLLYWLVMASYKLCGVHDWSARLIPGLAGVLTVLATWWWGRCTLGGRAGFWGALMLCLSPWFVYLERMLTMDGVLCLCVTVSLAAAHMALTRAKCPRLWLVLSAVACGCGLLAKGPVALVLVAPPVLAYRWLDSRCPRLTWRDAALYAGVLFAVAGPWYIALSVQEPAFAWSFFWTHNVVRFVAPFDHQKPFWFHLPGLLLGMLPWALLLPGLLRVLVRRSARTASRRPPALGFCLLAFVWSVVFFSASGCKRATYILPALPPLALALGCYLDVVLLSRQTGRFFSRVSFNPAAYAAGSPALPAALTALALGFVVVLAATFTELVPVSTGITLAVAALLAAGAVAFAGRAVSWPVTAATTFAVLFVGVHLLLPAYNRQFALRQELRTHAGLAPGQRLTVVCYPQRYDSVSFYLPDAEVKVYSAEQKQLLFHELQQGRETLLLVKSGRVFEELSAQWPPGMEYVSRGKQGAIVVGWVRGRGEPARGVYARRD